MKLHLVLLMLVVLLIGCSGKRKGNCDEHWSSVMKQKWRTSSECRANFHFYLGKGIYRSATVYFEHIDCYDCKIAPPKYGVNCAGDSISINNWAEIKAISIIAICGDY